MKNNSTTAILTAATLWGMMGLFSRTMASYGFTTAQSASLRACWAALMLVVIGLVKFRNEIRIKLCDLPLLALTGIISIYGTSAFYLKSIELSSMASASILMYTAPFFVMCASVLIFKEKFTFKKAIALIMAFIGCVFISGTGDKVTKDGIIFGVLAGIAYATYSIFGKFLLKKYTSFAVTMWAFIFAAITSLLITSPIGTFEQINSSGISCVIASAGMGLITALLPFSLYTYGLKRMDAGVASVMATLEPLVAAVAGALVYGEIPTVFSAVGILLVISAIAILELKLKK